MCLFDSLWVVLLVTKTQVLTGYRLCGRCKNPQNAAQSATTARRDNTLRSSESQELAPNNMEQVHQEHHFAHQHEPDSFVDQTALIAAA